MERDRGRRIAVVGGGIAGLAAAYELAARIREKGLPLAVDLYESSGRLGGVIRTEREGDYLLDAGPDSILTLKPWALELCRELGLDSEIIPTLDEHRGVSLYSRGKLRPLPYGTEATVARKLAAYVSSGAVSWRGKLRMAADLVLPRGRTDDDDESMAEFFGRRLGREAVDRLVDPLIAGIYSGDPARLSIRSTFPRFPQMVAERRSILLSLLKSRPAGGRGGRPLPVFCSLRAGLGRLVERLAASLDGVSVGLRTRVESVRRSESGYALHTPDGVRRGYSAVVLAVPAPVAARLLPDAPPPLVAGLDSIRYVSSATVFFGYRLGDLGRRPRGYGFLVPRCEGRRINGATWVTNKYAHRSPPDGFLVRCFVGGDRTGGEMDADDAGLLQICRAELRAIAGIAAQPLFGRVFRYANSGPQYDVGHARRIGEIEAALAGMPGLYVTGGGYRGIGIPDCVRDGRETARRLLDALAL